MKQRDWEETLNGEFFLLLKLKGFGMGHTICALVRYKQKSKDGTHVSRALVNYLSKANENPLSSPGSFPDSRLHHHSDLPPTLRIPELINHSHIFGFQRMRRQLKRQRADSSRQKPYLSTTSLWVV